MNAGGRAARLGGALVVAASLVYFAHHLRRTPAADYRRLLDPELLPVLLLGVAGSVGAGLLLVAAWRAIVDALGAGRLTGRRALYVYGASLLGKYLPGNVFHLAGRHLLATRESVPASAAASSIALEHASLALAAGSLALLHGVRGLPAAIGWVSAAGVAAMAGPLLARVARALGSRGDNFGPPASALSWWRALGLHLLFFLVSGAVLAATAGALADPARAIDGAAEARLVFAFAPAWIAGFLTPGAPAGLGVREAVLVASLQSSLGVEAAVLVALALRLVGSVADLLIFAWAQLLGRRSAAPARSAR